MRDGDPDGDGLNNRQEKICGTFPNNADSNPNNASDGGQAPPIDKFREIEFNINGDYAAWEMTIEGLGPDDTRTRKITMGAPNAAQNVPLKTRKVNRIPYCSLYRSIGCW